MIIASSISTIPSLANEDIILGKGDQVDDAFSVITSHVLEYVARGNGNMTYLIILGSQFKHVRMVNYPLFKPSAILL